MNKIRQRIRNSLMAKIGSVDFTMMGKEEYGDWVEALPFAEFAELIFLHDELKHQHAETPPVEDTPPEKQNGPDDNAWIPVGDEEIPVGADARIYVLFSDGDIGGPNRADAFLWGEPRGVTQILAYAPADEPVE